MKLRFVRLRYQLVLDLRMPHHTAFAIIHTSSRLSRTTRNDMKGECAETGFGPVNSVSY